MGDDARRHRPEVHTVESALATPTDTPLQLTTQQPRIIIVVI